MKILRSETHATELILEEPYEIAYETIDRAVNVFLQIHTECGLVGYGCAAPDWEVTGETGDSVLQAYRDIIEPGIRGRDPLLVSGLLEELRTPLQDHPSAMAMLDMALFDLLGKACNRPLYQVLGGCRNRILTSITIGILPVQETVAKATAFVNKGFKVLKVKGGSDVHLDIERMIKVREAVGEQIYLRFDANQGYSLDQALIFSKQTSACKIEFLEQPTHRSDLNLLGKVTRQVRIPVMADESVMNLEDVLRLASEELVDTVNIKIQKVGGILEGLHMNSVAKAAGLEVMVGCMDESAMAIAAGLHFALSRPNICFADLDGHFDWQSDPAEGSLQLRDGFLVPNDAPGLGSRIQLIR